MLVLTRKVNDSFIIGTDVRVTVLSITGEKVRIGIDAPQTVKIVRGETIEETRSQNKVSVNTSMNIAQLVQRAVEEQNKKEE